MMAKYPLPGTVASQLPSLPAVRERPLWNAVAIVPADITVAVIVPEHFGIQVILRSVL